jgi:UTP:GlnB (protein PII) uridylyltransferase
MTICSSIFVMQILFSCLVYLNSFVLCVQLLLLLLICYINLSCVCLLSINGLQMSALKNLGLNVVKANVFLDSSGKHNKFAITTVDTGRKVEDPELLEAIRLTIINNLLEYHPESSSQLAMGAAFGIEPPPQKVDVDIATRVNVYDDGPDRSLLYVEAADRPGLLVDLVKMITDINIAVESGEFDTEGLLAKAKFHVSYRGKAIIKPLQQVLGNSLRYFLRRPSTEESSF